MRITGPELKEMLTDAPKVQLILRIGEQDQTMDIRIYNFKLDTECEYHPYYEELQYIGFSLTGQVLIPVMLPTVATVENSWRI